MDGEMMRATVAANEERGGAPAEAAAPQYSIVYGGDDGEAVEGASVVHAATRRELELLLLCLGDAAAVVVGEGARARDPGVLEWLEAFRGGDRKAKPRWERGEEDEVLDLLTRIPIAPRLGESAIRVGGADAMPERIPRRFVHKSNAENVLISAPYRCGNMFYFNGFTDSPEFRIDHPSDHVEGILVFEAARQCGIATGHLVGIPEGGGMILLRSAIHYKSFVELGEPYVLRSVGAMTLRGTYGYNLFHIFQGGRTCAYGYFAGFLFKDRTAYDRIRAAGAAQPGTGSRAA